MLYLPYLQVCIVAGIYTHVHICIYIHVYSHVHTNICVYIDICILYIYVHIHSMCVCFIHIRTDRLFQLKAPCAKGISMASAALMLCQVSASKCCAGFGLNRQSENFLSGDSH